MIVHDDTILIAVAPNGARKTKLDHPALPLSVKELIQVASSCAEAGAGMMHFHVRNSFGKHTLDAAVYSPVLRELTKAVGDSILLQVSSESAGIYQPAEQIEQMKRLAPHCISCGVRELVGGSEDYEIGSAFFTSLHKAGVLIQYILYSPEDVAWYETLCRDGVICGENHLLLFVLGKSGNSVEIIGGLADYISALTKKRPWMVCGFGLPEHDLVTEAVQLGGHVRVGFENNHQLPDGRQARDNAALVKLAAGKAKAAGRSLGNKQFAESLHKE